MQEKTPFKACPIRYVKGVGPKKSDLFEKLGIDTVSDLFYYLPRRYEDRSRILEIKDLKPDESAAVIGKVAKISGFTARTGTRIFEMTITGSDSNRRLSAVWYNQPFMRKMFSVGQTVLLYGKVEIRQRLQMSHPVFEILQEDWQKQDSLEIGRIVPVYSLTENLNSKYMRKIVYEAIRAHLGGVQDNMPTRIRARRQLVDIKFAVRNIHFPYSDENLEKAYKRLVFDEFFILQVVMALRRKKITNTGIKHEVREGLIFDFEKLFAFELTGAQKKCIKEIQDDMASDKSMHRLLQGDVGSGKTVVSMYAMLLTCVNGYQAVMMAPTEILARQHYINISKTFMPLGLNVRLLTNGLDKKTQALIKNEISKGDADIVIGTHSLIQDGLEWNNLGLAIIDEQHKFGVMQRKALKDKGIGMPDTLVMTATPIPRSLALTIFGDMDVSLLREKPEGRKEVTTLCMGEEHRDAVYKFIRKEAETGKQVFMVYPRVKKDIRLDVKSAEEMYAFLSKQEFKDLRVALIHGRMKGDAKNKIMNDFREGKYDILVATTVIEVGVDMPDVSLIVVEHAEMYGLAQLHQLRGRIGRGKHVSCCIFIGDPKTDIAKERLSAIAEISDGFELAEKDLDIRGPGEFLGARQSGLPELRFGNIAKDFAIMEAAREEAFDLVKQDPGLMDFRHSGVRRSIRERFRGKVEI
ncbi:MAG: ATP-dependent DNA helicase RecG [Candidatus Omnitrophota bacterium]